LIRLEERRPDRVGRGEDGEGWEKLGLIMLGEGWLNKVGRRKN